MKRLAALALWLSVLAAGAQTGAANLVSVTAENFVPETDLYFGAIYMVRLYRPRAEALKGGWKFPEARAAS